MKLKTGKETAKVAVIGFPMPHLSHALHHGGQLGLAAGELLKSEPGNLSRGGAGANVRVCPREGQQRGQLSYEQKAGSSSVRSNEKDHSPTALFVIACLTRCLLLINPLPAVTPT